MRKGCARHGDCDNVDGGAGRQIGVDRAKISEPTWAWASVVVRSSIRGAVEGKELTNDSDPRGQESDVRVQQRQSMGLAFVISWF
jgi:hypothetical protein